MTANIPLKTYLEAYLSTLPNVGNAAVEVDALAQTLETTGSLRSFIADLSIDVRERRTALEIALPQAEEATLNLALILARDRRLKDIARLPEIVRSVLAERASKKHATIVSAVPLTSADMHRVTTALEKIVRSPVTLEEKTDASLLAGFRVQVGDWSYDASLRGRLDRLQHALTL